jgi:hypothetical protein
MADAGGPNVAGIAGGEVAAPAAPSPLEAARAALVDAGTNRADRIRALEDERRAIVEQKKKVSKDIKNEGRKRARLVEKAKNLSDDDLMEILSIRAQAKANAKAKAKAKAKAAA